MIKFKTLSQRSTISYYKFVLQLAAQLLELPLAIVQRADGARFEPTRYAMKVVGMVANTPGHGAFLEGILIGIRLAFDAQIHYRIAANGASVHGNIWEQATGSRILFNNHL